MTTEDPTMDEFTEVGHDDKAKRTHRVATQRRKARYKRARSEGDSPTPDWHQEKRHSRLMRTRCLTQLYLSECEQVPMDPDERFVFADIIDDAVLHGQPVTELTDDARSIDEFYEEHPLLVDTRELNRLGCFHVDDPRAVLV